MFIMYDEDMYEIPFPKGVTPLDIYISSIEKERVTDKVEGANGNIDYGSVYSTRDVELNILLEAKDTQDYRLLKSEVYAFFQKHDSFFVSEEYEKGKRYLVSVDNKFIPDRVPNNQRYAEATIDCTKLGLPFAESIGTTQDIERNGIDANDGLWGFGMGLLSDEESLIYTHTGTSFSIYNAGNVTIHPFMQDLKITIDNIQGASDGFELLNKTNGTSFKINEQVNANQEIVLDGPNITSNDLVIDPRMTNRGFIQLSPGWNEFELNGADNARTAFDFRFYYF